MTAAEIKCGPDNCPIVAFSDLTPAEQRVERKRAAEKMYLRGFTMEQIARQLGVSQATISGDLGNLSITDKLKSARTATNPKGAGRPKSNGKRVEKKPGVKQAQRSIDVAPEVWDNFKAKAVEEGSSAAARLGELVGRAETFNKLLDAATVDNFTEKGALRIEDAIRIHKARLDKQFEDRVNAEVRRRIDAADDATRASNKALRAENLGLQRIVQQQGIFTEKQYKQMVMLAHEDDPLSSEIKRELLQVILKNKIKLVKGIAS